MNKTTEVEDLKNMFGKWYSAFRSLKTSQQAVIIVCVVVGFLMIVTFAFDRLK